jgi:hypothetical protein
MNPQQLWSAVLTVVITVVGAILYQTHHIDERIDHIDKRIDDLKDLLRSEVRRLEDLIKSEVKRLEDRLERLEHPIHK